MSNSSISVRVLFGKPSSVSAVRLLLLVEGGMFPSFIEVSVTTTNGELNGVDGEHCDEDGEFMENGELNSEDERGILHVREEAGEDDDNERLFGLVILSSLPAKNEKRNKILK